MNPTVLVTGASGYVGGRLVKALTEKAIVYRCLTRNTDLVRARVPENVEIVSGDIRDEAALEKALEGIEVAYYLVHSMAYKDSFIEEDRRSAILFGRLAQAAHVKRIVYLGGLGHGPNLSSHLRSRQEVGEILRSSGVPTIEFRASIIIGSGSLSFEMIRALVEKLPVMITPRWVRTPCQPIAIEDVIEYLVAAINLPLELNQPIEIGGADVVTYGGMMSEYAKQRGLKRLMIPVPVLTPRLSSLWLGLVTPLYARVGKKLIAGVQNPTVVENRSAEELFTIRPRGVSDAIARALQNEDDEIALTRWSDALSSSGKEQSWGGVRFGSRLIDSRTAVVSVSPEAAFQPIARIGGENGWYFADWLWNLRGFIDLLCGGVGVRRGRRHPERLTKGEALDFWRVEEFNPPRQLRLVAEMKVPGRAWLQFEVTPSGNGSEIRQTALFDPHGIVGLLYWYSLFPLHQFVFGGMLRAIAQAAEKVNANER